MTRLLLVALLLVACRPKLDQGGEPANVLASAVGPADSLVLTLPDSTQVWLVKGREGVAADGSTCVERGVQLVRKGGRRDLVPLLYTRTAPVLVDGKLLATLSNRCADVATYTIDATTAQPTRR
jgi:hypothetical protein